MFDLKVLLSGYLISTTSIYDHQFNEEIEEIAEDSLNNVSDCFPTSFNSVGGNTAKVLHHGLPVSSLQVTGPDMSATFPHSAPFFFDLHQKFNSNMEKVLS